MNRTIKLVVIALIALAIAGASTAIAGGLLDAPTIASAGSYTLKWSASDPALNRGTWLPTYPHLPPTALTIPSGGRLDNPLADAVAYGPAFLASNFDAVSSLAPKDLVLGQIVPFQLEVSVTSDTSAENGTISVSPNWLAKTTSGGDFGFDPSYGVIAAFVDSADPGTVDAEGDATVDSFSSARVGEGTNNDQTVGTLVISGLDNGDNVIVEIWVVLKDSISAGVTGNVQTNLIAATTTANQSTGAKIQLGNQTVPLLQVGDFLTKGADLSIGKTDGPDPVVACGEITYTIAATNNSPTTWASKVVVTDTLGPGLTYVPGSAVVEGALFPVQADFKNGVLTVPVGGMAPAQTTTITYRAIANDVAPRSATSASPANIPDRTNTARISCTAIESNLANNVSTAYTGVTPSPSMRVSKTATPGAVAPPGGDVDFTFEVTNSSSGGQSITVDSLVDSVFGDLTSETRLPVTLAPGEKFSHRTTRYVALDAIGDVHSNTATFTAEDSSGYRLAESASATVGTDSTASIELQKLGVLQDANGNGVANVGELIAYTFTVRNTGVVPLSNVVVTDPMVAPLSGGPISLDPGEEDTSTFYGTYSLTQADIDWGSVTNFAHVEGSSESGSTVFDNAGYTLPLTTNTVINLEKSGVLVDTNEDGIPNAGETIRYTFTVQNLGDTVLTNVAVVDPKVTVNGGPLPSLAPGDTDSTTFWGTYTIAQSDITEGRVTNVARVQGDQGGMTHYDADEEVINLVSVPRIELVREVTWVDTDGDGKHSVGDKFVYRYRVKNTGNVPLDDVRVTDPKLRVLGGPLDGLDPGEEDTETFTAERVLTQDDIDGGVVDSTSKASGDDGGKPAAESSTTSPVTIVHEPSLTLVKSASVADYSAGQEITYYYAVTNTGNVSLRAPFAVTDDRLGVITSSLPTTLAPSETTTLTATHLATSEEVHAGTLTNVAFASAVHDGVPLISNSADLTLTATPHPALELTKTGTLIDSNENGPSAGDQIIYSFTVRNTGNVSLSDITISDSMVDSVSGGPIATLAPGATDTDTFSATYTLTQADVDRGAVTNVAKAEGIYGDLLIHDHGSHTITLDPTVRLQLVKTSTLIDANGDGYPNVNDVVNYHFTVLNAGEATVTDIRVTDPLIEVAGGPLAALAPGAEDSTTFYGAYTLTQADIDRGSVDNTARVTGSEGGESHWADASDTIDLEPLSRIELEKVGSWNDANVDGVQNVGDTVRYAFTVRNTGNVTLTNVTISDSLADVIGGPIGSLAPGEEDAETFSAVYAVTQADIDAGMVSNTATATAHFAGREISGVGSDRRVVTAAPALTLAKSADREYFRAGDEIAYTYVITNTGNVTLVAPFVVADDRLGSVTQGSPSALAPSESATLTATYVPTVADQKAGPITNTARASATHGDQTVYSAEDSVTVQALPYSLVGEFTKSANPASGTVLLPGAEITYTLTFTGESATNIPLLSLVDTLPASLDYVAGSLELVRGSTVTPLTDLSDVDAGTFVSGDGPRGVVRGSIHSVGANEVVSLRFRARVRGIEDSYQGVTNIAAATSDGVLLDDPAIVSHPIDPIEFSKTGTDLNGGSLEPGDRIRWRITVTNTGLSETTPITVTDRVPTHTTYLPGSIKGVGADDSGSPNMVWTVGIMPQDATVTLEFVTTVNAGVPSGTQIRNQAVLFAEGGPRGGSDAPGTITKGDATLLQTGGNDWLWLLSAVLLTVGGGLVIGRARAGHGRRTSRSTP